MAIINADYFNKAIKLTEKISFANIENFIGETHKKYSPEILQEIIDLQKEWSDSDVSQLSAVDFYTEVLLPYVRSNTIV